MALKKKDSLKFVCLIGVITFVIVGGGIFFTYLTEKKLANPDGGDDQFFLALKEFETFIENSSATTGVSQINRAFDKLEKKALSVESILSVMKRRRGIAMKDAKFLPAYQKAAQKAASRYPSSEVLAAVAADSLLLLHNFDTEGLYGETASALRVYASRIFSARYKPIALGIYVLLGDLGDPVKAQSIPDKEHLFPEGVTQEQFAVDDAILHILGGDINTATVRVNDLLGENNSAFVKRFAAEFFYNYDKPLNAAKIFSQFSDEKNMIRQADALYLSGNRESARSLWTLLSSSKDAEVRAKSLYNLASTEKNPQKAAVYLEKLSKDLAETSAPYAVYGLIRWARLQSPENAIMVLESKETKDMPADPLIHLEVLRRQREMWVAEKTVAHTWILLNKHPSDQRLYEWAGWLFDFQKYYNETEWLVKNAASNNINGAWLDFHESVALLRANKLDEAYKRLTSFSNDMKSYAVPANIARILEARRDMENALMYYKNAAALETNAENAARIQFRISRCLRLLGRDAESKTALETAISLNPDYLDARIELKRFGAL